MFAGEITSAKVVLHREKKKKVTGGIDTIFTCFVKLEIKKKSYFESC